MRRGEGVVYSKRVGPFGYHTALLSQTVLEPLAGAGGREAHWLILESFTHKSHSDLLELLSRLEEMRAIKHS